jgi:hypothetical protein
MRIVFLKDGETIGIGEHRMGATREVADDVARVLIKRGIAEVAETALWLFEKVATEVGEEERNVLSCEEEREDGGE